MKHLALLLSTAALAALAACSADTCPTAARWKSGHISAAITDSKNKKAAKPNPFGGFFRRPSGRLKPYSAVSAAGGA